MSSSLQSQPPVKNPPVERRAEARVGGPFPVLAIDISADGNQLGCYAVLENFSACGFYIRLAQSLKMGEKVIVITQISRAIVTLQGSVIRVEEQTDGTYGLAVAVKQHQIFSSRKISGQLPDEPPCVPPNSQG